MDTPKRRPVNVLGVGDLLSPRGRKSESSQGTRDNTLHSVLHDVPGIQPQVGANKQAGRNPMISTMPRGIRRPAKRRALLAATGRTLVLAAFFADLRTLGAALGSALFLTAAVAELGLGLGTAGGSEGQGDHSQGNDMFREHYTLSLGKNLCENNTMFNSKQALGKVLASEI